MTTGEAATGVAVAGGATAGLTTMGGAALELPKRGGEERRTRGQKALPPRVFTILMSEMEKKGIGRGGGGGEMKGHGQLMALSAY